MRDPLWRLKTLPWVTLFQNALLTVLVATLLDLLLQILIGVAMTTWGVSFRILQGGIGQTLLLILIAGGIGALSVILMEHLFRQVMMDTAVLWALVGCLICVLFIKGLVFPGAFVGISQPQLAGIILGLFAQGRPYLR